MAHMSFFSGDNPKARLLPIGQGQHIIDVRSDEDRFSVWIHGISEETQQRIADAFNAAFEEQRQHVAAAMKQAAE